MPCPPGHCLDMISGTWPFMSLSALSARPLFGYCYQVHGPLLRYRGSVLCLNHLYPDSPNGRNTIGFIHIPYTNGYSLLGHQPVCPCRRLLSVQPSTLPISGLDRAWLDPWPLDLCTWRRGRGSYTLSPFRRCVRNDDSRYGWLDLHFWNHIPHQPVLFGEMPLARGTWSLSTGQF